MPALRLTNLLLTPGTRTRRDPDAVFDRLFERETRGHAPLDAEEVADLNHLRLVVAAYARFDGTSPLGWMVAQQLVTDRVRNRVRVNDLHVQHPAIADESVDAPVFVVGMPRTGTTLTYNLLSRSPAHRGPKLWEMGNLGLAVTSADEARLVRSARRKYGMVARLHPAWERIHPLLADSEEEDTFIRAHTEFHGLAVPAPEYLELLRSFDHRPDYRFLRRALQVLSYGRLPRRWVLKHPANLFHMPEIRSVFPDARFVWSHRDPAVAVPSWCSLAEASQVLQRTASTVDRATIGRQWLEILSDGVSRALTARTDLGPDVVLDLSFDDLTENPGAVLPELFERLDAHWGPADDANLAAARQTPTRRAPHRYTLERFGLERDEVHAAFADYLGALPSLSGLSG